MAGPIALTTHHVQLMRELNTYRLLTQDMMRDLGSVGRCRDRVGSMARHLVRKNLAARTTAPLVVGVRRLPHVYWLTHKGAATLTQLDGLSDTCAAIGADRRFGHMHEVMHRVGLVEIHMAARSWCRQAGAQLHSWVSDFEPGTRRGRQKATTINGTGWRFTPDAVARVTPPGDAAQRLLLVELERGGEAEDLSSFMRDKLPRLRDLASGELVEQRLGEPRLARFVIVFSSADMRARAMKRWPDPDAREWRGFFLKSLDELQDDFGANWHQLGGRPVTNLFGPAPASSTSPIPPPHA